MATTAVAIPQVPVLPKHPTWLLSRWGISASQLSALLLAAAKLEQQVTGPKSLAEPPEPWRGTPEQKKVGVAVLEAATTAPAAQHSSGQVANSAHAHAC